MMAMEREDRTGDRILYLLKSKGPQTAAQLAHRLDVTPMAVRQHLYGFNKDGLIGFTDRRRPVGRPVRVWALTERAAARFPENHAELTLEMIAAVRATFGEEGLDRLLAERTRVQLREYRKQIGAAGARSLRERVRALAAIRRAQGYMAECVARADGTMLLRENHCPICIAAKSCQGLCREELALFQAVLGPRVRIERTDHILAGASRCAYVITPRGQAKSAGKREEDDEMVSVADFEAMLAEHADAVCFRCKVRLKDHRGADHLFFEDPEDAPDEEFN
jgi:predicted ArsR family transcriptional regulator